MRIVTAKGTFGGLYEWGRGWRDFAAAQAWRDYWSGAHGTFWHVSRNGDALYLVTTGGSIYLHPMDFVMLLRRIGAEYKVDAGRRVEVFSAVEELTELCEKCAAACGGTFSLSPVKVHEVEV